jgi:hypothetical protein
VRVPQLRNHIQAADLAPDVAHAFHRALRDLADVDGPATDDVLALIDRLVAVDWTTDAVPAPQEALWHIADLFLSACLYVAVSNGSYTVDQARHISRLANALGLSARQLSELEQRVMGELERRGTDRGDRGDRG